MVRKLPEMRISIPRGHAAIEQNVLHHRRLALRRCIVAEGKGPDVPFAVAGDASPLEDGGYLFGVWDLAIGPLVVERDQAAVGRRFRRGDRPPFEKLRQRRVQVSLGWLRLLSAGLHLVVKRATVKD